MVRLGAVVGEQFRHEIGEREVVTAVLGEGFCGVCEKKSRDRGEGDDF